MGPGPDQDVVSRCRLGSEAAWAELYATHAPAVARFLRRVLGPDPDLDDVVQRVFVSAFASIRGYRGEGKITTWLFGIARRVLLEAARAGLFDHNPELPDAPSLPRGAEPDERIDLERALASLGVSDREALVMVDMLGFEPIEVAQMLAITPEAFRVRLHRARGRLREAYGR